MPESISPEKNSPSKIYRNYIRWLATAPEIAYQWPGLKILEDFVDEQQHNEKPDVRFTVLDIYEEDKCIGQNISKFHFSSFEGHEDLDQCLAEDSWSSGPTVSSRDEKVNDGNPVRGRLFVIENLCAESILKLGAEFDIDPHFWADYLANLPWYRITHVPPRLSSLPSSRRAERFLKMDMITPRELVCNSERDPNSTGYSAIADDDAKSYIQPDQRTTRLGRKAGLLRPAPRDGTEWPPMAFIRQSMAVWAKERTPNGSWVGIVLLDPLFLPLNLWGSPTRCLGMSSIKGAEFRNYCERPTVSQAFLGNPSVDSTAKSFCDPRNSDTTSDQSAVPNPGLGALGLPISSVSLKHHGSPKRPLSSFGTVYLSYLAASLATSQPLQRAAVNDIFVLLGDLYSLIASEWLVVDEYVNRELATIEYRLEKKMPDFRELQNLLQVLFVLRRRCTRYAELITDARTQCQGRGQNNWPRAKDEGSVRLADESAGALTADFEHLHAKLCKTMARIEKNINLLTALVSIGEAEQSLLQNEGVARLTLMAALYLPLPTVAAIMAIPGDLGPGRRRFWIYWMTVTPLTILVMLLILRFGRFKNSWAGNPFKTSVWGALTGGRKRKERSRGEEDTQRLNSDPA
ncbi:MAG: hypothetical protein M1825_004158 [Sarcosagium campestre]|nr:MAG: hypothetical protein M1825_004158 [Sarcosagium campestre]